MILFESFEKKARRKTTINSLNSCMKADASFAAKFERRYHFLEVDKDANLMARRICVGESATRISDVVATRFLRQISTHYCRAIRLESTVSTNEVKFFSCDIEKVNYRHFIVISR